MKTRSLILFVISTLSGAIASAGTTQKQIQDSIDRLVENLASEGMTCRLKDTTAVGRGALRTRYIYRCAKNSDPQSVLGTRGQRYQLSVEVRTRYDLNTRETQNSIESIKLDEALL